MKRRSAPEVVRVRESSPDEAETSFRELDDVFLQSQTRIWLGEVLHERFGEEMAVADLLADGELLFQVSKTVWKMILKKNVDMKHSKFFIYERTSVGKADGRYMAYPKVDSFLKICQILGLTSIDLFSPSDVVERRDIRRVCMCIRSLSKKARLKNLSVPDFDIVTYTIAMPTNLVGGLRRSLEQSRSNSFSSYGGSPPMYPRGLYKKKTFSGSFAQHHDSFSESDEAESTYSEFEFQSPSSIASSPSMFNIVGESSLEYDNIFDKNLTDIEARVPLDCWYQNENDFHQACNLQHAEHEFRALFCSHSTLSRCLQYLDQGVGTHCVLMEDREQLPCNLDSDGQIPCLENGPFVTSEFDNNFHKLSNTGFENVPLERARKQNGNLNASTVLASDESFNRNMSIGNYVGLMTGKSDSIVLSCRPDLDMQNGDPKLREIKHKFGENITGVAVHTEISSPSSLSNHTSKTINILSADNDVYSCEAEERNFILEKQSSAVSEVETTCFPFRGVDIAGGSIDLFASPGRIKPPAECHMDTIADVFTLETDKPHSCLNIDNVESNGHILSSENKKEILLEVCKYAPAPSGSHSSDATPCVNSAFIINESNVSVIHKVQCTIGGGLIEDANKRVAPRIRIVDKEPNSTHAGRDGAGQFPLNINMYLPQESFVCDDVDSNSTCSGEPKLEGTSQVWSSEPVASPHFVIDSCHANNIQAHMNLSTSFSTGENEVNAEQSVTDTNQPPPVEDVGDKTGHKGNAVSEPKRIEDCKKETLEVDELNGKNTSDGSPKPGNKVLKSVAGGITLVGAAFLFLHFRGRRGRVPPKSPKMSQECSKNKGDDHGKQDVQDLSQRPSRNQETKHKGSTQKQEEKGRPKVFYPGGKLKL